MADKQPTAKTRTTTAASKGFTAEEKAAMRERAREVNAESRRGPRASKADVESDVLAKIAEMTGEDKEMAQRIHALIRTSAPELSPRLWYGSPAYARDGKVICFFQAGDKFKVRYATLGFSDEARLDEGTMWPTSYALTTLTAADETRLVALIRKAVG